MQKLGQHFLKNAAVLDAIADALDVRKGVTIIEIGPGHGELTLPLARVAERSGGGVIAIEKDRSLIPELTTLIQKEMPGLVTIIEGDVLKLLPKIAGGQERYAITGNIPYYITGKLLRVISELEHKPERTVLLVQKEVAERICAEPPAMNRLAASVQFWAEPRIAAVVSRKDFSPPPEVDSAVIVLDSRKISAKDGASIDSALYYRAVRGIFAQPRKTLVNNLVEASGKSASKTDVIAYLKKMGIAADTRPQNLGISQIIGIAKAPIWG